MSGRVAIKYLHVDVWTNMALRRAIKVLERVDQEMIKALGDGVPSIESMRGELRDLLARRRREHIGCGPRAAASWKRAKRKTEEEGK
jgi:hypothetical protein